MSFIGSAFSTRAFGPTNEDYLWEMQRKIILNLTRQGPCVIAGGARTTSSARRRTVLPHLSMPI